MSRSQTDLTCDAKPGWKPSCPVWARDAMSGPDSGVEMTQRVRDGAHPIACNPAVPAHSAHPVLPPLPVLLDLSHPHVAWCSTSTDPATAPTCIIPC